MFILQALWIAFSALFPMLFDEQHHLGIIALHSQQLSPFITHQPDYSVIHGDVVRDPNYLYHYLMSFPYRFITGLSGNFMVQVVFLRILNIIFVAVGLVIFRLTLKRGGFSSLLSNLIIAFFTFVPIVPFTAAQINYDNLLFPMVAFIFLATFKATDRVQNQLAWGLIAIITGMLASLVKFPALPILLAAGVYIVFCLYRQHGRAVLGIFNKQAGKLSKLGLVSLIVVGLLSSGLFVERYGGNLLFYGTIEPKCDQLHRSKLCQNYDVYRRNTSLVKRQQTDPQPVRSPLHFIVYDWVPHLMGDFFVTAAYVNGETGLHKPLGDLHGSRGNISLLVAGSTVLGLGIIAIPLAWWRRRWRPLLSIFGLTTATYALALLVKNYLSYTNYGQPVATQGRYFIPLLIPIFAMIAYSLSRLIKKQSIKAGLLVIALLVFTQGGGVMTYIIYSHPDWYWPNQTIIRANQTARHIISSFVRT